MAQFLEQLGDGPLLLDLPVGVRTCPRDPGLGARGQDHGQRKQLADSTMQNLSFSLSGAPTACKDPNRSGWPAG